MELSRGQVQVIAVAGAVGGVAAFLPLATFPEGGDSFDAMAMMPMPLMAHLPMALVGALMIVRISGRTAPMPLELPDRGVAVIVAAYAIVQLASTWLLGNLFDGYVAPGIGYFVALGAAITIGVVPVTGVAGFAASAIGQRAPSTTYQPRWVALAQALELPGGDRLDTGTWYLAVADTAGGIVLRLDDGRETIVPHAAVVDAAPAPGPA